jgi:hydroxypyruvate isomerase
MPASRLAFAPNISWLFAEMPFSRRPQAAAEMGFRAIEFGFPSQADLEALKAARLDLGLEIILFNQDVPVWNAANRGYLVDARRREEFRREFDRALEIAGSLEVSKVMLPAGVRLEDESPQAQRQCMIDNLAWAAPQAAQAGVQLTIEVLNSHDNPGYYLTTSREALKVIRQVGHPALGFQFDSYHLQFMEGDLEGVVGAASGNLAHVQFADWPGRHEPGTGQINFEHLQQALLDSGYQGYIGLEYIPLAPGAEALRWVPAHQRALAGGAADKQA